MRPSRTWSAKKPGVAIALKARSSARATRGQRSGRRVARMVRRRSGMALRDGAEDGALGDLVAGELRDGAPVAQNNDAGARADDLLQLGRDEEHGHALLPHGVDGPENIALGGDVDPARGLVEDQQRGAERQATGEQHLLLIDRKSTRLNSSHVALSRMPSSA